MCMNRFGAVKNSPFGVVCVRVLKDPEEKQLAN
jgi:hypothetical protein